VNKLSNSVNVNPYDENAEHYDEWFDTPCGRAVFESEVQCLQHLVTDSCSPWLEIGVGTGRFAQILEVEYGIDPSPVMLEIAAKRGINVRQGVGEELPYEDGSFGGVIIVVSLCFVSDPERVLNEAARVLRSDGRLIIGMIPADSSWGIKYAAMAEDGHPVYSKASFFSVAEVVDMVKSAGFKKHNAFSTLIAGPDFEIKEPLVWAGTLPAAGFVGMSFILKQPTGRNIS
jgi:SAM-dependent methyltransferase